MMPTAHWPDASASTTEDSSYRHIVGNGTSEAVWQAWPGLQQIPVCPLHQVVPKGSRAVIIAPHPDDEVLAFGGLLAMLCETFSNSHPQHSRSWIAPLVIAVTDGEASHPGSVRWPPAALARRRTHESQLGLQLLGVQEPQRIALSIPDGKVQQYQAQLTQRLTALLQPNDTVFSTWVLDGHPDHEATACATASAAAHRQCRHWQAPVWMWHWAQPQQPQVPWQRMRRLALPAAALRRKLDAIQAHSSQLAWLDTATAPVLGVTTLQRLLRPHEYLFEPGRTL